jgi:hypothetical protein
VVKSWAIKKGTLKALEISHLSSSFFPYLSWVRKDKERETKQPWWLVHPLTPKQERGQWSLGPFGPICQIKILVKLFMDFE